MPRLKPTKKLALWAADMLYLSALAPHEDLDWSDVREVVHHLTDEKLDPFQLDLLTDWVHKIAVARLSWRRKRPSPTVLKIG
jgi:hypothetical protein